MLGDLPNEKINPLVIFGAGASYDLVSEHDNRNFKEAEWRPPLTNNIFATNNNFFKKIQTGYGKDIDGLISEVRSRMRSGMSFEEVLTGIHKDEWEEDKENSEAMSLCWYLKMLFSEISDECIKNVEGTNYSGFFRKLKRFCKDDEVFVVNFNYDCLAQYSLSNILACNFNTLDSYIDNSIKLIHIHGSVLWEGNKSGDVEVKNDIKTHSGTPVLAIPTRNKDFVCPSKHIEKLILNLRKVNAVIIIGWSGTDKYFAELLELVGPQVRKLIVVSGENEGVEGARDILQNCGLNRLSCRMVWIPGFSVLNSRFYDFTEPLKATDYF